MPEYEPQMPDIVSDRTFTAIDERLGLQIDKLSGELVQFESDLGTAKSRATTEGRQVLLAERIKDLAALAHEAVAAAKRFDVPDEWIQNGPPDDED